MPLKLMSKFYNINKKTGLPNVQFFEIINRSKDCILLVSEGLNRRKTMNHNKNIKIITIPDLGIYKNGKLFKPKERKI